MADLKKLSENIKRLNLSVNRYCEIKKYLTIQEKFDFITEYKKLIDQHIKDYEGFEEIIAFVFFNLMVVKKYTNIKLDMTYEEFDILQESEMINKIVEEIGDDYKLLLSFTNLSNK